jgi:hypothetical protein
MAALGAIFYASILTCVVWRGLSWSWAAATLGLTYAPVIWLRQSVVRAGEGWLSRGKNSVHIDLLTVLRAEATRRECTSRCVTLTRVPSS